MDKFFLVRSYVLYLNALGKAWDRFFIFLNINPLERVERDWGVGFGAVLI